MFEQITKKLASKRTGKFSKVMREFYNKKLHSGSKSGPVVKDVKVAKAIAASEAGISRGKKG
jgi:hypothetical protein